MNSMRLQNQGGKILITSAAVVHSFCFTNSELRVITKYISPESFQKFNITNSFVGFEAFFRKNCHNENLEIFPKT